jgi:uncharacterized lipoprotein YbaY
VIDADAASFENGILQIQLEDVPFADAPASVIAYGRVNNVQHERGRETRISLQLDPSNVSNASHYQIRARVGFRDDSVARVGDYASEQSHPVLTYGHPNRIVVHVSRI